MKKIDLGQAVGLLANLGVIAGILFLAIEIRQNNELLASQARRDQLDARGAAGILELNNPEILQLTFKVANGGELTPYERYHFRSWAQQLFGNWEWQYDEYQAGILLEGDLPVAGWLGRAERLPELRSVWDETKSNRSPGFIRFIEENVFGQVDSHL